MNWTGLLLTIVILNAPQFTIAEIFNLYDLPIDEAIATNNLLHPNVPLQVPTVVQQSTTVGEDYDFIIVGAGSAGSVIANRLSEIGTWKILLLEAGAPPNSLAEFPGLGILLQFTTYNWAYETESQHHACLAMNNKRCPWPRGKVLGGSSSINLMYYTRGNPEDYNRWAALGNPGWSYADVLPYFLKSEDARLNNSQEAYHNRGGYLSVENTVLSEFGLAFIAAGLKLGYPYIDHNSPAQIGFSRVQATTRQGRRDSTATAFLLPALQRKNLRILSGAKVTKILIDPLTNAAFGVEYIWGNSTLTARALKEVILSAGAFSSAQLLMLTGIGPKSQLEELGIKTLRDLPVGQTLYDHIAFSGVIITTNVTRTDTDNFNPLQILRWYNTGEGPLASIGGFECIALLSTHLSKDKDYPDVEINFRTGSIRADNGTIERRTMGISDSYYNQMYPTPPTTTDFSMDILLLHPRSKGFMKLRSSNPHDYPLFYPNYFTDPEHYDIQTLVAGIRIIERLAASEAFKKHNAQIFRKPFVGCEHLPFDTDEHWQCAIQLIARSAHHQTSTCKMGPPHDPTAVVDHNLRVYGIRNLRVADISVMPIIPSAHTNAAAIMIGEKASDIIKQDWGVFNY